MIHDTEDTSDKDIEEQEEQTEDTEDEQGKEQSPEISFHVETTEDSGEPVFAASEEETVAESHEDEELEGKTDSSDGELNFAGADQESIEEHEEKEQETLEASSPESGETNEADGDAPVEKEEGLALTEELTLSGKVEAIIFASPKPLRTVEIHELLMDQGYTLKELQDALDELSELYRDRGGGFHLKYIKRMGYQFQTTPAAKNLMEKQFSSRPRPLSRAALETLAVIAYRQKINKGVTRAEVEFIRGVDAGSIFKTLVERGLLTCIGRKEIPGRPMMFGVTDEFLKIFQLGSINDLPPLESFQSPPDVIKAANDKIAQFEAEQEGVDPEAFIGDESYTETLGEGDFDILEATAVPYAPSLVRLDEVRAEVASAELESQELNAIPPEILAGMAEDNFAELSDEEFAAAAILEAQNAVPAQVIEQIIDQQASEDDLIEALDSMAASDIAFSVPEAPGRAVEGASLAPQDDSWYIEITEE